ncbi:helix-turn-helix domain-containing protein [Flavobacterium foetidum]|uniref:helix-turn-helix domain-containing protein n=1 Tax=Flavobacterium foetidum TaxID=2026681 RepID=UPI001074DC42|nr:helix-turn-helix domain-containing protein [Flavobacterium foetidum]KAF2514875.1 AraC family transcriptional regulator [Flavobacterium foetidum]
MKIKFYKPINKILEKYIEGYYFIDEDNQSDAISYWTFPNNYTIVTITQNGSLKQSDNKIVIVPSEKKNIFSNITYRYNTPIEIFYLKPLNEVTIYFKPMGIHFFLDKVENYYDEDSTKEIEFNPFSDFKTKMGEIFGILDREKQIEELEDYWLSKFVEKDFSTMKEIIAAIETNTRIEEIAKRHKMSRQYLNKLFKKNIGKSASEYRKIHRFRKAIFDKNQVKNLTQLSYKNSFYDQSHFVKDFKDLTLKSPKSFFEQVDTEKETIWFFL